jgi:predicted nicotinamide N-methyase
MEVLEAPSEELLELLADLEYEPSEVSIPGIEPPLSVRVVDEIPLELLTLLRDYKAEISGRRVWPGSVVLALAICQPNFPIKMSGQSVLELGAGSGLIGMVGARLGAERVVITDGDQISVDLAAGNLEENGYTSEEGGRTVATRLLWGKGEHSDAFKSNASLFPTEGFNIIVAADVMYKPILPPLLFETIKMMLAKDGVALICHILRAGVTQDIVVQAGKDAGFTIEKLTIPHDSFPNPHCTEAEAQESSLYLLRHMEMEVK